MKQALIRFWRVREGRQIPRTPSYGPTKRQANHQCLNRNILKNFAIIIFHTYLRRLGSHLTSIRCDPGGHKGNKPPSNKPGFYFLCNYISCLFSIFWLCIWRGRLRPSGGDSRRRRTRPQNCRRRQRAVTKPLEKRPNFAHPDNYFLCLRLRAPFLICSYRNKI